jgi:hypothetical protein
MVASQHYADHVAGHMRRGNYGRARELGAGAFEQHQFKKTQAHEFVCHTWFERDRAHIRLETPKGRVVFELWDENVGQAIEDGFLSLPQMPRPTDRDWQPQAVQYALDAGLITLG